MGGFLISPLPPVSVKESQNSGAPSLRGRYPASTLLRAPPPPSRLRPTSRGRRLYGLPGPADFAVGRGGLLQLLDVPSSPCRRSHPAGASRRVSRCDGPCCLRPPVGGSASGASHFRGHLCVHSRYGPVTRRPSRGWPCRWASGQLVSLLPAIRATGVSALPPAGLTPAEHISLTWTHNRTGRFPASGSRTRAHAF